MSSFVFVGLAFNPAANRRGAFGAGRAYGGEVGNTLSERSLIELSIASAVRSHLFNDHRHVIESRALDISDLVQRRVDSTLVSHSRSSSAVRRRRSNDNQLRDVLVNVRRLAEFAIVIAVDISSLAVGRGVDFNLVVAVGVGNPLFALRLLVE